MIATMLPCPCEASAAAVMSTVSPGMNGSPATSRNTIPKTTQSPKCSMKCVTRDRGYRAPLLRQITEKPSRALA